MSSEATPIDRATSRSTNATDNLAAVQREAGESDDGTTLQRKLSLIELIALGVGAIVGAGIFVTTGEVAAHHAGPAIVLSFLLGAGACMCAALCYAEYSAMMPVSGSAYSYASATFGERVGWVVGWCLILEYLMAGSTVAIGWSGYLGSLLQSGGLTIPAALTAAPVAVSSTGEFILTGSVMNLPAAALLTLLTILALGGVRLSVRATAVLVSIKLAILLLFIVCGAFFVNPAHWQPFLPANTGEFGEFGWSGVVRGAGIIFYAYLGFDAVSTAGRETRNPQRNMPLGIIGSLVLCTVIYIAFSLVLTGLAPYSALGVPNPISVALSYAGEQLHFLKIGIEIAALVGLTSVLLVLLYAQSRVIFAFAKHGLVPQSLAKLGKRSKAPTNAVLSCGVFMTVAAGLLPIQAVSQLISMGTLTAFLVVCCGVLVLRVRQPDLQRPVRIPWAPVVCVLGMLTCGYLMVSMSTSTWTRFAAWVALGLVIYQLYGKRSAERARRQLG
jgi:basic amino acid/polyamine antiporter, APA family